MQYEHEPEKCPYVRREKGGATVPYARYTVTSTGHCVWEQSRGDRQRRTGFAVHRLLAIAEHGAEAVAGKHIHHKNEIPWDNRLSNLEVLDPVEHRRQHTQVSDAELIADLRAGYEVLGVTPTTKDVEKFGEHGISTYVERFGSFVNALKAAGIPPRQSQVSASDGGDAE